MSRLSELLFKYPGRVYGVLGAMGDAAMASSGIVFDNVGRTVTGLCGLGANLPITFFSGRKRQPGEIDPQDLPFKQKIKEIWKFWKYPFEFGALANLTQTFGIMLFSGPDTASAVGQQIGVEALVSQDQFRPLETLVGAGGVAASSIGLIREEQRDQNTPPAPAVKGIIPNLRQDWNAVTGFAKNRARDLVSEGMRVDRGLHTAFENGCMEIACAGPNKVTAKMFNSLLYPWAIESAFRQDWNNIASACIYRACNYFYARASKRSVELT